MLRSKWFILISNYYRHEMSLSISNELQGPLGSVQVLCHQVREGSLNENDDSEDPLGGSGTYIMT